MNIYPILDPYAVHKSLFDADTFLYASDDNTPVATSPANVLAALSGHAGAAFDWSDEGLINVASIGVGTVETSSINAVSGNLVIASLDTGLIDFSADNVFNIGTLGAGAITSTGNCSLGDGTGATTTLTLPNSGTDVVLTSTTGLLAITGNTRINTRASINGAIDTDFGLRIYQTSGEYVTPPKHGLAIFGATTPVDRSATSLRAYVDAYGQSIVWGKGIISICTGEGTDTLAKEIFGFTTSGTNRSRFSVNADFPVTFFEGATDAESLDIKIHGFPTGLSNTYGNLQVVGIGSSPYFNIGTEEATTGISITPGTSAPVHIGDGVTNTNYTAISATGVQTMAGTARVWKSQDLKPGNIKRPQSDYPGETFYQNRSFDAYDDANEEQLFYLWHVPNDFATGTASVRGHFGGMVSNEAGNEYVAVGFEYWKFSPGDTYDTSGAADGGGAVNITIVNGEGDYVWHESDTGTCDTTGWAGGDVIVFRFFRDVDDTYTGGNPPYADNYTGDVLIGIYHLEYLRDKLGAGS